MLFEESWQFYQLFFNESFEILWFWWKMESRRRRFSVPWTRRSTLKLISLLKIYSVLWLPCHKDYLKYNVREQAYRDIALELHKTKLAVTIDEIRKKIHTLRSQYLSQVNSILEEQRRFGVVRQPSLWSFKELSFLWPIYVPDEDIPNFLERGVERNEVCIDNVLNDDNSEQSNVDVFDEDIMNENTTCIVTIEPVHLLDVANVDKNIPVRPKKLFWNRKQTKKLIEYYRQNELLWNPTHDSYDDQKLRDQTTEDIARQLAPLLPGITSLHVKAKLHTIRSQYRKQLRNMELQKDTNIPQRAPLWCFKLLYFLWPICKSGEYPMPLISGNDTDDNSDVSNIDTDDSTVTKVLMSNKECKTSDIDNSDYELYDVYDEIPSNAASETEDSNAKYSVELSIPTTIISSTSARKMLPNQKGNNFKCRYNWLGDYTVSTLNELKHEDVIYDTVNTIENLLDTIRTLDADSQSQVSKTHETNMDKQPPQRRLNPTRPKLSYCDTFDVSFNLTRLCIGNIKVKVISQAIIIEGEYTKSVNSKGKKPKYFVRHYELPNGFDFRSVTATLSVEGILRVMAHKVTGNRTGERIIKIKRVGSSNLYSNFGITNRGKNIL